MSFTIKHVKDPSRIYDIIKDVQNIQYDASGHWMAQSQMFEKCGKRGMNRLLERAGEKYQGHEQMMELFDDVDNTLMRTLKAQEPLSVLCHGDYHSNTLLFQYDDHGCP